MLHYRAAILGQTLVVEVQHEPGWHSYGMDNVMRSQAVNGKNAECELPTVITLDEKFMLLVFGINRLPKIIQSQPSLGILGASRGSLLELSYWPNWQGLISL